jgi:hypothetical protein
VIVCLRTVAVPANERAVEYRALTRYHAVGGYTAPALTTEVIA